MVQTHWVKEVPQHNHQYSQMTLAFWIVPAGLLLLAVAALPDGYYQFLRRSARERLYIVLRYSRKHAGAESYRQFLAS